MKESKKITEVLNDLIKINNDRIDGYEKAASNADPSDTMLKTLFYRLTEESHKCKKELIDIVLESGGTPADDQDTFPGKIYRLWMDIKVTFAGNDTVSTLNACEFGEDAAQKAYALALEASRDFPGHVKNIILGQKNLLHMSHDLIRNQRDAYREVEKEN